MKKLLMLFLIVMGFSSWKWTELSLKNSDTPELLVQTHWVVDTVRDQGLRKSLIGYSSPLITDQRVIAGNFIDGVKAYDKKTGCLIWDFSIPSAGISKPLILYKGVLYFGGRDGFLYSLDEKTGSLKWKYFTGSELAGQALVEKDRLYFLTQDQKLYALDLEGNLIWIHSHPAQRNHFNVRGNISPLIKEGLIYAIFQKGVVKALKVKDANLVWQSKAFKGDAASPAQITQKCLLVSIFESYQYCLNFKTGEIISKSKNKAGFQKLGQVSKQNKLNSYYSFPAIALENYLIYGFSSYGKLQFLKIENGQLVNEYPFGRGLAGSISIDSKDQSLYFLSVDSYLHKISLF